MLKRSEVTGQTADSKIEQTDTQIQKIKTYQSRNTAAGTSPGTNAGVGEPQLSLMHCWKLSLDKSESQKPQVDPVHTHFCGFYFQKLSQGSCSEYQKRG